MTMNTVQKEVGSTPGPWSFSTEPQPNGCPIVGARGLMVAMLAHSVNHDDQRETALANARLIAAAPELLEALQAVHIDAVHLSGNEFAISRTTVAKVAAALSKALGQSGGTK